MADRKYDLDWSGANEEISRLILRQGELFLDAQYRAALAADQRAMVSASLFSGFSVVILGATIAYFTETNSMPGLVSGIAVFVLMAIGAFLCMHSARPVKFTHAGAEPRVWWNYRDGDLIVAIGGEAENYQERIEHNEAVLRENAFLYTWGARLAWAGPIVGFIVWVATTYQLAWMMPCP